MPEGYTHVRTAQKAAHAIHYKLQCPAAFAAGANGPDSFFCYEVWKKGQNRTYNLPLLGNRMHEDKTGAFLLALLHHTHTQAQIEYTLGFCVPLCGGYRYAPLRCVRQQPRPALRHERRPRLL